MPEEKDSESTAGKPHTETSINAPVQSRGDQNPPSETTDNRPQGNQDETANLARKISGEKWLIGIGIVTLLVNTCIALIYYGQLKEMKAATKATQDAVCVASRTLSETQRSNKEQAVISKTNMEASQKASADSLKATMNNFRQDQRAWVVPFDMSSEQTEDGKTIFKVLYRNTGHTPALHVNGVIGRNTILGKIPLRDKNKGTAIGKMLLAPNGVGNTSTIDRPLARELLIPVRNGLKLYVFGTIFYEDVFKKEHWTQFCFYPSRNLDAASPCPIHNETDDTQQKKKS